MDCDVRFLAHELKVMDEQTARNRVFFVSAKEVLQLRTRQQNENQGRMEERWDGKRGVGGRLEGRKKEGEGSGKGRRGERREEKEKGKRGMGRE